MHHAVLSGAALLLPQHLLCMYCQLHTEVLCAISHLLQSTGLLWGGNGAPDFLGHLCARRLRQRQQHTGCLHTQQGCCNIHLLLNITDMVFGCLLLHAGPSAARHWLHQRVHLVSSATSKRATSGALRLARRTLQSPKLWIHARCSAESSLASSGE